MNDSLSFQQTYNNAHPINKVQLHEKNFLGADNITIPFQYCCAKSTQILCNRVSKKFYRQATSLKCRLIRGHNLDFLKIIKMSFFLNMNLQLKSQMQESLMKHVQLVHYSKNQILLYHQINQDSLLFYVFNQTGENHQKTFIHIIKRLVLA